MKIYHHDRPLQLEMGGELPELTIAYHTFGEMNADKSNVVWVCHALTANSDVTDWWPHTVEKDRFLDPAKYFIICANILGSCYGTTGPLHTNPATGKPYYRDFPTCTIRDIVRAHQVLADALGIDRIHTILGSSVGGFQCLEWAVMQPDRIERLVLVSTDAKASPWVIAINETQRMAIISDATYYDDVPEGGSKGLAAARAIGLLSYRASSGYNLTQQDAPDATLATPHRACTYQRYQGEKLVKRFDAYSYTSITLSFDSQDVGRGRGGIAKALSTIKAKTLLLAFTTDILFPVEDMRRLTGMIPGAELCLIESPFGHDGFLVEADKLNSILKPFICE